MSVSDFIGSFAAINTNSSKINSRDSSIVASDHFNYEDSVQTNEDSLNAPAYNLIPGVNFAPDTPPNSVIKRQSAMTRLS